MPLGVQYELKPIRDVIEELKPDVAFNLLEQFHGETAYDQNVASYLELLRIPYTGCNPRGLMLARGKALSKKLVAYHRIPVPAFAVFPMRRKMKRPARLGFPLIVKSVSEDASIGIAQASVVENDEKLEERVVFIHEKVGTDALVEQYIEGRELYVGVLGNDRLRVLPVWEFEFGDMGEGGRNIATAKAKHDLEYQEKLGIKSGPAKDLTPEMRTRIANIAKRVCRTLEIDGYSRVDFRLGGRRHPLFPGSQPQSRNRQGRGFRRSRRQGRPQIPRPPEPHRHPGDPARDRGGGVDHSACAMSLPISSWQGLALPSTSFHGRGLCCCVQIRGSQGQALG